MLEIYLDETALARMESEDPLPENRRLGLYDEIRFPPYNGPVHVNMMPFRLWGEGESCSDSLPEHLSGYSFIIETCIRDMNTKTGADRGDSPICFLTVHEGLVDAGQPQRRAGLHCELPGVVMSKDKSGRWIPQTR